MLHLQRQSTYKRLQPKTKEFVDDYLQNILNIQKYRESANNISHETQIDAKSAEDNQQETKINNIGNISKIIAKKDFKNEVSCENLESDTYFDDCSNEFMNFLFPEFETNLHDPLEMKDMQKAVDKIVKSILENKKICIYGDYDCDGVPATALMRDFFEAIKYENVIYYIPDRHKEGYGLNMKAVESLAEQGINLLITLDLGTTNIKEIERANKLGIETIITDHHLPLSGDDGEILPPAYAVLNHKRAGCNYKDKNLCGSGIAYKLISALIAHNEIHQIWKIGTGLHKWILDLVGIATIADMVPLVGENRTLAIYGMHVIKNTKREGLRRLISNGKVDINMLTETDIGFTIAPRINAASRMKHPRISLAMLSRDVKISLDAAGELEELNTLRKDTTKNIMKKVYKVLDEKKMQEEVSGVKMEVIVIGDSTWSAGILGIIASNIVDKYGKTTFVYGGSEIEDGVEIFKGSVRTAGDIHVVQLMSQTSDLFTHFGGHAQAGGFAIEFKNLLNLEIELNEKENLEKARLNNDLDNKKEGEEGESNVDNNTKNIFEIDLEDVSSEMLAGLSLIGPFGVGNPRPLFKIRDLISKEFVRFGKANEHVKVILQSRNAKREAIKFFCDKEKEKALQENFHEASFEIEPGWRSGPARLKII
jgi:single-stranded-DNA-specific exonuclease